MGKVRIVSRTTPRAEVELEDSNADPGVDDDIEENTEDTDSESTKTRTKGDRGDTGAQQVLDALGGTDYLMALVADTDVQAIIEARRKGAKTKVVLDGEVEDTDTDTEEVDAVDEVVEELDDDLKKIVKALRSDIRSQIKPLTDEVNALKGIAGVYQKEAVNTQIKTVAKKYKDFPKYQKAMAQLARDHPGLAVKELYLLSKSQAGDLRITEKSTESERPTPTPRRRVAGGKKRVSPATAASSGRRQWNDTLANALDNLEFVEE